MSGDAQNHEPVTPAEFVHVNGFVRFARIVQAGGVQHAFLRVLSTDLDRILGPFDRKYHTETGSHLGRDEIATEVGGQAAKESAGYVPMVAAAFAGMLRELVPEPEGIFVDIGSGRGRCLILALDHGYRHAVGIELSPMLCRSARENLDRSGLPGGEIYEADATTVELPAATSLIFLYNPFSAEIWKRVLEGPIAALGRPVTIVTHSMHHAAEVESDLMRITTEQTIWKSGRDFVVLTAQRC